MTPKEKAKELFDTFYKECIKVIPVNNGLDMSARYKLVEPIAKDCALIAVTELISEYDNNIVGQGEGEVCELWDIHRAFWNDVKKEIELI